MIFAIVAGVIGAMAVLFALHSAGRSHDRMYLAVLLVCVAAFYPVFTLFQTELTQMYFHTGVFLGFFACAVIGARVGMHVFAYGLIAHGALDVILHFGRHPGPDWWAPFCAAFDVTAGSLVLIYARDSKVRA